MIKMNKELKDNIKEVITLGNKKCYSISEVLKAYYENYKQETFAKYDLITYRGKLICLDIDDENNEDDSLWSNLQKQIDNINEIFEDEKDGE